VVFDGVGRRPGSARSRRLARWLAVLVASLFLLGWAATRFGGVVVFAVVGAWLPFVCMLVLLCVAAVRETRARRRLRRGEGDQPAASAGDRYPYGGAWGAPVAAGTREGHRQAVAAGRTPTPPVQASVRAHEQVVPVERPDPVAEWRYEQLRAAGYPESEAAELAGRDDVDLHLAERLLAEGCPSELALRILR